MLYFEAKVRYYRSGDDGIVRNACESYLVEADKFADAEIMTIEHVQGLTDISVDIQVSALKPSNIGLVHNGKDVVDGKFYRVKVKVLVEEDCGAYRKCMVPAYHLVYASCIEDAGKQVHEFLEDKCNAHDICSITETDIVDIIFK